jgi:ABC-type bacteriocin/lantibiotic exporter with double-glycine peptidase domain
VEAKSAFRTSLIFLLALGISVLVLFHALHREINVGGCGPRALYAVASRLGSNQNETDVFALFPGQGFDVSLAEMESAVPKLGLKGKSRQMAISELCREQPMGVLHIDDTHFIAVVGYETDSVLIVDSLYKGENMPVRWLCDDLKTRWDGAILVISRK